MIQFRSVSKRYPDGTVAVEDLCFEVPQGQITVLVGPSGCGKTTTLRMVNRMIEPTEGRILVDGQDVTAVPAAQLRRSIGYVIQDAGLFPHRSVLANVMTVPRLLGWDKAKAKSAALDTLAQVGLSPEHARRYPSQLSGGQRQRVGVARALAARPSLVLMDEPFSAVDPLVRAELQQELRTLQHELGITVVLVTHDIDEALTLGDTVVVMRDGAIAQAGAPDELLADPANDFIASFVGKDRGYRALGFRGADLTPERTETVALGGRVLAGSGWVLATDEAGRPRGWVDATGWGGSVRENRLRPLGTTVGPAASPRELLDAALLSPAGRAVVVDGQGALVGTVDAHAVLDATHLGEAERVANARARARRHTEGGSS